MLVKIEKTMYKMHTTICNCIFLITSVIVHSHLKQFLIFLILEMDSGGPLAGAHGPEPRPGDADPLLPLRLLRRQARMLRPMAPARHRRGTVTFPGRGTGRYHRRESRAGHGGRCVSQGLCRELAIEVSVTSSKFSLARPSSYVTKCMWVPLLAPR